MTWDFWLRIPLGMLVIIAIWNAFAPGNIFGWLGDRLESRYPEFVLKPVFLCLCCMASLWGSAVWFYTGGDLLQWPLYVLALSGALKLLPMSFIQK